MRFNVSGALGVAAVAMGLGLAISQATAAPLPLPGNFNFLTSSTSSSPKTDFETFAPTGWTYGNQGGLVFIASSSTSSANPSSPCGSTYLQTYGCPSTLAIPGGYNVVEADGNPTFESSFTAQVGTALNPLVAGTTYTLSFYQAASQQTTFDGATTNQWIVSLGSSGSILKSHGAALSTNCTSAITTCSYDTVQATTGSGYNQLDPNAVIATSQIMNVPNHGLVNWQFVTVSFVSKVSGIGTLSFLAWGNSGNTANQPPMAFLTGVNAAPNLVPEPASLAILGFGLAGLGAVVRRRRSKPAKQE